MTKLVCHVATIVVRDRNHSFPFASALSVLALLFGLTVTTVRAQNQNGNIHGTVTDQSSSAMAGVTVTLTSPALLVSQTAISNASGIYHFEQLPIGTYELRFDQGGFAPFIRQNIGITAGFSAEVNVQMSVGSVSQSVTVTAEGPVVDTTSTTPTTDLSTVTLTDQLPVTRLLSEVVAVTPGVVPSGAPDLGGGGGTGNMSVTVYGITGQETPIIEGVVTRQSSSTSGGTWDMTAMDDFQVVAAGGNAEIALPGVFVNAIVKTGGNSFHARGEANGENSTFESNNLTPFIIAQGSTTPQLILNAVDLTGQFGGRIIRDKWWFFGSGHVNRSQRSVVGYLLSNGQPGSSYQLDQNETAKTTYQISKNYKVVGFYDRYKQTWANRNASSLVPTLSSVLFVWPVYEWKAEIQGTPNSKTVVDFFFGRHHYDADYFAYPDPLGIPSQIDQTTSIQNGPTLQQDRRPRSSWQPTGSIAFIPSGSYLGHHELKFGSTWMFQSTGTAEGTGTHGDYTLTFKSGVPAFIGVVNYPVIPVTSLHEGGFYGEDTWHVSRSLTVNVGLRMDRFSPFVPEQTKPAGPFGPPWTVPSNPNLASGASATYPRVNIGSWTNVAPRIGAAWDVFGKGKTVMKASWGRYNWTMADDFGNAFDSNAASLTTYKWTQANAGCTNSLTAPYAPVLVNGAYCDYTPGTVNLDPNGPAFVKIGGSYTGTAALPNTALNPNLTQQYTSEFQGVLENQLGPGLSARIGFTYAEDLNQWVQIPNLIPYSAWNIPVKVYDPGPSATLTATPIAGQTPITLYDLAATYKTAAFNQQIYANRPNADHFETIEATVVKRPGSGRWNLLASYTATREHRWISTTYSGYVTNPNQLFFPLDTSWNWQARASGTYKLPWKFDVSAVYQIYSGLQGQRSSTFNLPNNGQTTIFLDKFGSEEGPLRPLLNLRFARDFHLERLGLFRVSLEVLNTFNSAAPWTITRASGASFNKYTAIDTPRIVRAGVVYSF